jgi:phosphomannomutase
VGRTFAAEPGVATDHLDGLTVSGPEWWFNVRTSNTEPLLRLNVEAADPAKMARVRDRVLATIRSQ